MYHAVTELYRHYVKLFINQLASEGLASIAAAGMGMV